MAELLIEVEGTPRPKGSMTGMRNPRTGRIVLRQGRDSSQRARYDEWCKVVFDAAVDALDEAGRITPILGPVAVHVLFVHARPQSTPKGHRWRSKTPDIDKLSRAVLDVLKKAAVFGDDNQVAELVARKVLARDDEVPGARIYVYSLDHAIARDALRHVPSHIRTQRRRTAP